MTDGCLISTCNNLETFSAHDSEADKCTRADLNIYRVIVQWFVCHAARSKLGDAVLGNSQSTFVQT